MSTTKDNELRDEELALVEAALGEPLRGERRGRESIRELVQARLERILARDFARLPQVLYRLDISEARVDRVFEEVDGAGEIPGALAELVMQRLETIAQVRREYEAGGDT